MFREELSWLKAFHHFVWPVFHGDFDSECPEPRLNSESLGTVCRSYATGKWNVAPKIDDQEKNMYSIYYIHIYIYVYVEWSGVLELFFSRTTKIGQFRNIWKQLPIYSLELLFKLSKRFETGGGRWLKFGLKNYWRGWSQQAEKDQRFSFNPTPPVSVWSLPIHYWSGFMICVFEKYLVLSQQKWCSYVGIKEQHHRTNPLNVAELHLGPPYNYILVWQTKTLNSKPTKNTSHESTKNYFTPQLVWKHQRGSMNHPWVTPRLKMYQIWGVLNFDSCRNRCIEKYWMVLVPITSVSICLSHYHFKSRYWLYSGTSL